MDRLSNLSGKELNVLSNTFAIFISNNFSKDDIEKLVVFFTALADILALISVDKIDEDIIN